MTLTGMCKLFGITLAGLASFIGCMVNSHAESFNLAVAANFIAPAKQLVTKFEATSEHSVKLISGSSGKIYAQIVNGAPFDIFLSADQSKPLALTQRQLSVDHSQFTYAVGSLVLYSTQSNNQPSLFEKLKSGTFNKLAIANPKLAPYGVAAMQFLEASVTLESYQNKLVFGENIAQAMQFVNSGNAELGIVALSQIRSLYVSDADFLVVKENKSLNTWLIPTSLYAPIKQDAVLLKRAEKNPAAQAFIQFLRSDSAQQIILSAGYSSESGKSE